MISSVWLDSTTDSMDMNLSRLQKIMKNRKTWHAVVHGVTKNQTQFSNWKTTTTKALYGAEWMKRLRKLYHRQLQVLDHWREHTSLPYRSDEEDTPEREKSLRAWRVRRVPEAGEAPGISRCQRFWRPSIEKTSFFLKGTSFSLTMAMVSVYSDIVNV